MGGSLINHGGQNPLEAARYGCNILHGPNILNFKEIYQFLKLNRISNKVNNEKKMINTIDMLFLKKTNSRRLQAKLKLIGHKILETTYKEIKYII